MYKYAHICSVCARARASVCVCVCVFLCVKYILHILYVFGITVGNNYNFSPKHNPWINFSILFQLSYHVWHKNLAYSISMGSSISIGYFKPHLRWFYVSYLLPPWHSDYLNFGFLPSWFTSFTLSWICSFVI